MEDMRMIAAYIRDRYQREYHTPIDEMKFHKMMYFAQRESLIQTGEPLFDATFYGWKYGPVLKELRQMCKNDDFPQEVPQATAEAVEPVMDAVFREYAPKDSWSLSRLTHGEISWRASRKGIPPQDVGDKPIELRNIRLDADRIRQRRSALTEMGLL